MVPYCKPAASSKQRPLGRTQIEWHDDDRSTPSPFNVITIQPQRSARRTGTPKSESLRSIGGVGASAAFGVNTSAAGSPVPVRFASKLAHEASPSTTRDDVTYFVLIMC